MKRTVGIDLKTAAKRFEISDFMLRKKLASMGAIRKTYFGWEAQREYSQRGLLKTDTRQASYRTEAGYPMKKSYTVVLITGDGLSWLQDQLNTETKQ